MKRIFFHSYKGGVGRSYVLANVAYELVNKGKRIGLVDLDYDAPGLVHLLSSQQRQVQVRDIDILHILVNQNIAELNSAIISIEPKKMFLLTVNPSQAGAAMEKLYKFIIDTNDTFNSLLEQILRSYADLKTLDYILIDLRPGFSFLISTIVKFSDMTLQLFRTTRQDIYGTKILARAISPMGLDKHILIPTLIPMKYSNYEASLQSLIKGQFTKEGLLVDNKYFIPLIERLFMDDRLIKDFQQNDAAGKEFTQFNKTIRHITNEILGEENRNV
ncbi:Cobyrinic acid a,c-diamide synthase domain protein [Candidatus Magnetoovum chiemensis]|nr:Cobyrinic acid a,c-diamide synthase domain protein [Candidatus Magnetoovum chiemensis]